jgi:hypothetical protein
MRVLATYPSSSSNTIHEVRQGDDNVVYCTCPGWRFHNKRWCRHLEDYTQQLKTTEVEVKVFKQAVVSATPIELITQQVIAELKEAGYGN